MARYLKVFAISYTIVLIIVGILSYVLETYFQISMGSATSFASLLGAVTFTAQSYAKNEGQLPTSGFNWKFAALSTLVAFVISAILSAILELIAQNFLGGSIFEGLGEVPLAFFAIGAFFVAVMYILATRFIFPFFVKSQLKALEKMPKK